MLLACRLRGGGARGKVPLLQARFCHPETRPRVPRQTPLPVLLVAQLPSATPLALTRQSVVDGDLTQTPKPTAALVQLEQQLGEGSAGLAYPPLPLVVGNACAACANSRTWHRAVVEGVEKDGRASDVPIPSPRGPLGIMLLLVPFLPLPSPPVP